MDCGFFIVACDILLESSSLLQTFCDFLFLLWVWQQTIPWFLNFPSWKLCKVTKTHLQVCFLYSWTHYYLWLHLPMRDKLVWVQDIRCDRRSTAPSSTLPPAAAPATTSLYIWRTSFIACTRLVSSCLCCYVFPPQDLPDNFLYFGELPKGKANQIVILFGGLRLGFGLSAHIWRREGLAATLTWNIWFAFCLCCTAHCTALHFFFCISAFPVGQTDNVFLLKESDLVLWITGLVWVLCLAFLNDCLFTQF